jgi:hypothetical protein
MEGDDTASNASKPTRPQFKLPLGGLATSKEKTDVKDMLQKNSGRRHAGESYTPSNISARGTGNTFTPSAAKAPSKYGGMRAAGQAGANQTPMSSMLSDSCMTSDISTPMDAD